MNNLLKRENKKRKRNKNNKKNNESFNRKNQNQTQTQNKFVNINGKWQKLENKKGGDTKLSANEEFKKNLFGKDENEEYIPIQKNSKKFNTSAITEMEEEHSHIFSSSSNLEKILKNQREKYASIQKGLSTKSQKIENIPTRNTPTQFKTILGKNIVNYLNDLEISDRNIFSERDKQNYDILYRIDLNKNFEIPMLIKKEKERRNFKMSIELNEDFFQEFEKVMIEIRDGTRQMRKDNKDIFGRLNSDKLPMEDDEDIFDSEETTIRKIPIPNKENIKLNLTSKDEEDFFKFKNIDLATLLKPYQKK